MGSATMGFVKNNKKVTWKEFARMLAVLAVPIALQNLLTTTALPRHFRLSVMRYYMESDR